jgi:hypothetical protein
MLWWYIVNYTEESGNATPYKATHREAIEVKRQYAAGKINLREIDWRGINL